MSLWSGGYSRGRARREKHHQTLDGVLTPCPCRSKRGVWHAGAPQHGSTSGVRVQGGFGGTDGVGCGASTQGSAPNPSPARAQGNHLGEKWTGCSRVTLVGARAWSAVWGEKTLPELNTVMHFYLFMGFFSISECPLYFEDVFGVFPRDGNSGYRRMSVHLSNAVTDVQ